MNNRLSILLAGPSLLALATTALAQPAATPAAAPPDTQSADPATVAQEVNQAAEEAGQDGAIIITARRRAENLLDVPQTVAAVTGQDLQEYNLTKFQDIAQLVPGLTLQTDVTSGIFNGASVRGTTFSQAAQGSPIVETYFNEHPIGVTLMFQGQFDIGQIEVLKGPQGTQRGRSSPSGAMTVTTRRPDLNEVGGAISMLGTSRHAMNVQAALGIPIIQDKLAIRLAALLDQTDSNQVESSTSHQSPSSRTVGLRATARFEPTDSLSAVVMYQRLKQKGRSFGGILFGTGAAGINTAAVAGATEDNLLVAGTQNCPVGSVVGVGTCGSLPGGTPRIFAAPGFNGPPLDARDFMSVSDFPSLLEQKADLVTAQLDWRFAGQKLSYVGGWHKFQQDDSGGGGDASNTIVGRQSAPLSFGATIATEKRFTNELRLSSDERLFGMIDYTLGAYHGKQTNDTVSITSTLWAGAFGSPLGASAVGGPGLLQPTTFDERYGFDTFRHGVSKLIEKAAFANVIAHLFNDKLELEAGARKIWVSSTRSQTAEFLADAPPTNFGDSDGRALMAIRNPNGLGPCPLTLSGTNTSGVNFINAQVVGSTYPGTCDVQMTLGNGINPSAADSPRATRKDDAFVYRLSASYHITPDHMAYITYGTAWRAGPGPITGAVPNCAAQFTPGFPNPSACDKYNFLEPDKAKSFEIGLKGSFFDRRLNTTVAVYKQKFSGFFVFGTGFAMQGICAYPHFKNVTVQPGGCNVNANALTVFNAPVDTKGIDFDFNFRISDDLNFGGAASWAEGKFASGLVPCSDRNFDGIPDGQNPPGFTATQFLNGFPGPDGTRIPDSAYEVQLCDTSTNPNLKPDTNPKWNFNLRGEYSHEVFTGARGFLRALFNYTPKNKNLNPATTFVPKAYGILNLYAGIRADDGAWEVSVAARNILNKKTVLTQGLQGQALTRPPGNSGQQLQFSPANQSGYRTISFVPRREFQVSARFAFGSR